MKEDGGSLLFLRDSGMFLFLTVTYSTFRLQLKTKSVIIKHIPAVFCRHTFKPMCSFGICGVIYLFSSTYSTALAI